MHCRNCSNEVNEKAIGCPKCGMDPRKSNRFCPSCGNATAESQVMCTQCGVALNKPGFSLETSTLPKFDVAKFTGNKANIAAVVALLGCLLPWLKVKMFVSQTANMFSLASGADSLSSMNALMGGGGSILVSGLLLLFPIALIGFLVADLVPAITKHKKWFLIGSLVLIVYAGIGLYQLSNPSLPESNDMFGMARKMTSDAISIGWGYYVSAAATIATFVLAKR